MQLNAKKCKYQCIGNSKDNINKYNIENEGQKSEITKTKSEKDLGVTCDSKMKFSEHASNRASKVCNIFGDCCTNITGPMTEITDFNFLQDGLLCSNVGQTRCRIVNTCNRHWENETIKEKCENVDDDFTLTDVNLLPVVALVSTVPVMFRNPFCALCNYYSDFVPILPGLTPRSCDVFRLLDLLPVPTDQVGPTLTYMSEAMGCELILEASQWFKHCRKCGCLRLWMRAIQIGYIDVRYTSDDRYQCTVNGDYRNVTDGVCTVGDRYIDGFCVRVFDVVAPVQAWRFLYMYLENDSDTDQPLEAAEKFLNATKRSVSAHLDIGPYWLLHWNIREILGLRNTSAETCALIQLDIIVEHTMENPHDLSLFSFLFEKCEECQQLGTFVPEFIFNALLHDDPCSVPQCEYDFPSFGMTADDQTEQTIGADITVTTDSGPASQPPHSNGPGNGGSLWSSVVAIVVWLIAVTDIHLNNYL
ncbi:uncharacterized protein [Argopecten irradians]|uniref:uncharacterized protein n=1 Tax=Argopecten irradians TaxID=31199 RepID=UPI003713E111